MIIFTPTVVFTGIIDFINDYDIRKFEKEFQRKEFEEYIDKIKIKAVKRITFLA